MDYRLGRFTLQPHRQLLDAGRPVPLGTKPLDILSVLAAANGKVVTKDELFAAVWQDVIVEENALQVHVSALRKALDVEGRRLVVIRGRGYRLDLAAPDDGQPTSHSVEPARGSNSVAVMPFANLSGDASKDYLADGIAEELIVTLARGTDLQVPARTSTFAYKGRDCDVRRIADDLGVAALLEGSVRVSGERIRVTAELIDAQSGFHLWSESYDRLIVDLFELQDELAREIARALRSRLTRATPPTSDLEAFHLYLQARSLVWRQSRENLQSALELLDTALERDPNFARAYSERAWIRQIATAGSEMPLSERNRMRADAETALSLDPASPDARALLGILSAVGSDWVSADQAMRQATECAACTPEAHVAFAVNVLAPLGHLERALACTQHAFELAPAAASMGAYHAALLSLAGNTSEAARLLETAVALGFPANRVPATRVQAEAALEAGRVDVAAGYLRDMLKPVDPNAIETADEVAAALVGKRSAARACEALDQLFRTACDQRIFGSVPMSSGPFINWYARLGDLDRAFVAADAYCEAWSRTSSLDHFSLLQMWSPAMRPFREDERFQNFVRALNMLPYWQKHGPPDGHDLRSGKLVCLA